MGRRPGELWVWNPQAGDPSPLLTCQSPSCVGHTWNRTEKTRTSQRRPTETLPRPTRLGVAPGGPGSGGRGRAGSGSHFLPNKGPRSSPNRKPAQDGARSWILTEMPLREEERTPASDHRAAATRQAGGRSSDHLDPGGWPCQELSPSSAVTRGTHAQDETRQGGKFAWTHAHLLPDNLENIKVPIPKASQCSFPD